MDAQLFPDELPKESIDWKDHVGTLFHSKRVHEREVGKMKDQVTEAVKCHDD